MDMRAINEAVIGEFRANGGKLSGPMEGAPVLLLTTTGRCSGASHTTPVGFVAVEGRFAAAAANGGSDDNPDWYRNIENDNDVTLEIPGASLAATATVVDGAERAELLRLLIESLPGMADHVAGTTRDIPVVVFSQAAE